jgi:hypothetical protein
MYAEMFCFREDLILENMELRAKIEGLKNCSDLNWIRVKALLARAADALKATREFDFIAREVLDANGITEELIAKLRKEAE